MVILAIDKSSICMAESVHFISGLLNSQLLWWYIQQIAASRQGGFYEFKPMYVTEIPIAHTKDKRSIELRVEQILAAKQANPTADVTALEREIDELVYALYGLTPAEIALVEGRELSEAEEERLKPSLQTEAVRSNRFSGLTAEAVPTNLFTGQPPQGSFREKQARIETLTQLASPAGIQELTAALTDPNMTIRWQAGAALRKIGGAPVVEVLQAFIAQTEDATAKAEAEKILQGLGS